MARRTNGKKCCHSAICKTEDVPAQIVVVKLGVFADSVLALRHAATVLPKTHRGLVPLAVINSDQAPKKAEEWRNGFKNKTPPAPVRSIRIERKQNERR